MAPVAQALACLGQMQGIGHPVIGIGRHFLHQLDQIDLEPCSLCKPCGRRVGGTDMDEDRHGHVVSRKAEALEVSHGLGQGTRSETAGCGQIVGRHAFVSGRRHQMRDDVEQLLAIGLGDLGGGQTRARLVQRPGAERGREDLHPVFLARDERRFLKPGDRRLDARVVGRAVPVEFTVFFGADDFA